MARILRQEIKETILRDNQLAADFCNQTDLLVISLPQALRRNSAITTQHDTVMWLCERLNKTADEVLFDDSKVTA